MPHNIVITQSNYIPWKGYFDSILAADEFVFLDEVQYTKRDWRNRNKIKTQHGIKWLTIPVIVKGNFFQSIKDTKVADPNWNQDHWKTIQQSYAKSRFYREYKDFFEELYLSQQNEFLSEINFKFITALCGLLKIDTKFSWSNDYNPVEGKTERLVDICKKIGAKKYFSGPAARDYIEQPLFDKIGVQVEYFDYTGYPEYPQLHDGFDHAVSIIDLIFNVGPEARAYLKYGKTQKELNA